MQRTENKLILHEHRKFSKSSQPTMAENNFTNSIDKDYDKSGGITHK